MKYFNAIPFILFATVTSLFLAPVFADNLANVKQADNKTSLMIEDSKTIHSAYPNAFHTVFTEINATRFAELSKTEQETLASV